MAWPTIAAIYFVTWWTVLFAVLPWGVRSQAESGDEVPPGTDPGAPSVPALKAKLLWTTVLATVIFGVFYYCYVMRLISIDGLAAMLGMRR
jgi:predicted secreted protein